MSEAQKIDQPVPPAESVEPTPTHAGTHLTRMFFGLVWVAVTFALLAGACYLAWPWIMAKVARFYD